jgi:prepilin-type N-terminal cleavage/methylation domain-containing protein
MRSKKSQAFSLIELLVVIAIIGILSAFAVVSLGTARAKARDARRLADVKELQIALEMYYLDNNDYPPATKMTANATLDNNGVTYMSKVPANQSPYTDGDCASSVTSSYQYATTSDGYTITYCLGSSTGGIDAGTHTASPSGIQ